MGIYLHIKKGLCVGIHLRKQNLSKVYFSFTINGNSAQGKTHITQMTLALQELAMFSLKQSCFMSWNISSCCIF